MLERNRNRGLEIWLFILGRSLIALGAGVLAMTFFPRVAAAAAVPAIAVGLVLFSLAARGLLRNRAPQPPARAVARQPSAGASLPMPNSLASTEPSRAGGPEADLMIGKLELWVHGRQVPDAQDHSDGNFLDVRARMASSGATVEVSGWILSSTAFASFHDQCCSLYRDLQGSAVLGSLEPDLRVSLRGLGHGHIAIETDITPDYMNQRHQFRDVIDQTYLPPVIQGVERILQRFPVRGRP